VEGFGGVCVRRVCAEWSAAFAIGEAGELFSWGHGEHWRLGHGDERNQPSPKCVEALRGVWVSSVSVGDYHVLALTAEGSVYTWGYNEERAVLGSPHVWEELLPNPVEALRSVRVGSIATAGCRCYAVADTGELWAWGFGDSTPLGHGEQVSRIGTSPELVGALQGVRVDAVVAGDNHTFALTDDGSVFTWGSRKAALDGALGLGPSTISAVRTPQRIPVLRVACGP
jgi:alpha-tubulin suppressor-like RCC1 family protein